MSSLRIPIHAVAFDTDVRGPGPKPQSAFSKEYARQRKGPGMEGIEIHYEVDVGLVVLELPSAKERSTVFVPIGRVRFMEPIPPAPAATTKKAAA